MTILAIVISIVLSSLSVALTVAFRQSDKNDNSKTLFFPACGFCEDGYVYSVGNVGYYWSSSPSNVFMYNAWFLAFYNGDANTFSNDRYYGYGVRGVLVDK